MEIEEKKKTRERIPPVMLPSIPLREKTKMGRPRAFESPEALEKRINGYFEECKMRNAPYTMSGLAVALNVDRRTVVNYSVKDEFFPIIKRARTIVELYLEEHLLSGKPPVGAIFVAKNNFNWVDKHEIEHNHNYSMGEFLQKLQKLAKTEDKQLPTIEGEIVNNPPTVE